MCIRDSTFRAGCAQMLDDCAGLGLNTVLAQVRPFGDALYRSSLFPWSHLCTGVQGADPGFDPLDILLQEAHGRGLSVEAWLNPYRLRSSAAMPPSLAENNLANTHPEWVCAVGDGLYLNPAEPAAADYVVQGVAELLQNYAVDGIHFDDYFYPTTDAAVEKHVPVWTVENDIVHVKVGSVEHPMLPEHYIEWVSLHTKQGNQRKELHPGDAPEICFALCEGDEVESVYAYCNLHGLWKA